MKDFRLKPCPFCGGEAVRLSMLDDPISGTRYIGCKKCCIVSFTGKSAQQTVDAWNTRWQKGRRK